MSEISEQLCYNKSGKINALGIAIATRQGGLPNHLPKHQLLGVAQEAIVKTPIQFGIVYKAQFPNGKVYVGITTKTLEERISQHMGSLGDGLPFHNAIRKYGKENVIWEVIDTANSMENLNEKESRYIEYFNSFIKTNCGYNCTLGGGGSVGFVHTKETRAKISAAGIGNAYHLGHKDSAETLRRKRAAGIGRKPSTETRIKLSAAQRGNAKGAGNRGKTRSPEHRANIREQRKGKCLKNKNAAKLTQFQVAEIRTRYALGGTSYRKIAKDYGVSYSAVWLIVTNQSWV